MENRLIVLTLVFITNKVSKSSFRKKVKELENLEDLSQKQTNSSNLKKVKEIYCFQSY